MKKLSQINESIWSDIRDRVNGESIKKEDEKNELRIFFNRLKDIYSNPTGNNKYDIAFNEDAERIYVSVFKCFIYISVISIESELDNKKSIKLEVINPNKYKNHSLLNDAPALNDFYDKIKQNYHTIVKEFNDVEHWYEIEISKNDGVGTYLTNNECIEFIDFVIDNVKEIVNKNITLLLDKK